MKIAILGGTGPEGGGLGLRWAQAGHDVIVGSRQAEKGERVAEELKSRLPESARQRLTGTDNLAAIQQADIAVLAVPYSGQERTLAGLEAALAGKLLLTVVVPLGEKAARVWRPPSGLAAAEEARQQLGEGARVVAAFQNISAHHLEDPDHPVDCDVLVCGDDKADKQVILDLCTDAGMRGVDAGPLQNASVAEGLDLGADRHQHPAQDQERRDSHYRHLDRTSTGGSHFSKRLPPVVIWVCPRLVDNVIGCKRRSSRSCGDSRPRSNFQAPLSSQLPRRTSANPYNLRMLPPDQSTEFPYRDPRSQYHLV